VLSAFKLDAMIEAVIGGDSLPQRKPDAVPLQTVIRMLGGTTESAVLIGDSTVDIACADNAGVPSIIIPSGYGMAPPQAKITATGFAGLMSVIEQL